MPLARFMSVDWSIAGWKMSVVVVFGGTGFVGPDSDALLV